MLRVNGLLQSSPLNLNKLVFVRLVGKIPPMFMLFVLMEVFKNMFSLPKEIVIVNPMIFFWMLMMMTSFDRTRCTRLLVHGMPPRLSRYKKVVVDLLWNDFSLNEVKVSLKHFYCKVS